MCDILDSDGSVAALCTYWLEGVALVCIGEGGGDFFFFFQYSILSRKIKGKRKDKLMLFFI